jgi:hypothetical protein
MSTGRPVPGAARVPRRVATAAVTPKARPPQPADAPS